MPNLAEMSTPILGYLLNFAQHQRTQRILYNACQKEIFIQYC
jgi:hypothetical protein